MERVIPERGAVSYRVRSGDTLSSIARQQTGSADYSAIYAQNKDQIGANPNNVTPGMILLIPGSPDADTDADGEEADW